MADYRYNKYVNRIGEADEEIFTTYTRPGYPAPEHGIYKCINCNYEIAIAKGHTLPPHPDTPYKFHNKKHKCEEHEIEWRLIVHSIAQS